MSALSARTRARALALSRFFRCANSLYKFAQPRKKMSEDLRLLDEAVAHGYLAPSRREKLDALIHATEEARRPAEVRRITSALLRRCPVILRNLASQPTLNGSHGVCIGEAKEDRSARVLDADRVGTLLDGAKRYAAAAAIAADDDDVSALAPSAASANARVENAAEALVDLLAEDTPASRLIVEQLVLVLGASSRTLWADLRDASGTRAGTEQRTLTWLGVDST